MIEAQGGKDTCVLFREEASFSGPRMRFFLLLLITGYFTSFKMDFEKFLLGKPSITTTIQNDIDVQTLHFHNTLHVYL